MVLKTDPTSRGLLVTLKMACYDKENNTDRLCIHRQVILQTE